MVKVLLVFVKAYFFNDNYHILPKLIYRNLRFSVLVFLYNNPLDFKPMLFNKIIFTFFIFLFFTQSVFSQVFRVENESSNLKIFGTSNLHDWEMKAHYLSGDGMFVFDGQKLKAIETLNFNVEVESLKSGKSKMDRNTYEALDSKNHKTIQFTLLEVLQIEEKEPHVYLINSIGKMSIAGTTQSANLSFFVKVLPNELTVKGQLTLNMTHYKVKPPQLLFGTIKTGEAITIHFDVIYNE